MKAIEKLIDERIKKECDKLVKKVKKEWVKIRTESKSKR